MKRRPGINKVIRSYVKGLQTRVRVLEKALKEVAPKHSLLKRTKQHSNTTI